MRALRRTPSVLKVFPIARLHPQDTVFPLDIWFPASIVNPPHEHAQSQRTLPRTEPGVVALITTTRSPNSLPARSVNLSVDLAAVDSDKRHPQDLVSPFIRDIPTTDVNFPQSQVQCHWLIETFPYRFDPFLDSTWRRPNRIPGFTLDARSTRKHPQDWLFPLRRFPISTMVSLPQSHRHIQRRVFPLSPPCSR